MVSAVNALVSDLEERKILAQTSGRGELIEHLASSQRVLYAGFDPSGPSLHLGNLIPLLTLRRFQLAGHKPIALVGGATGLIGDPSGRTDERVLNDQPKVEGWMSQIAEQVKRILDETGERSVRIVNNLDWTGSLGLIDFLRGTGKHFSVNAMIQRDSVKSRLKREGSGISFTEFSYMLIQANDYVELARQYGCSIQVGGSDQWGNIVSGIDLVRRVLGRDVFALTLNLLTKDDGSKFGKSESSALWLDPQLTSPYAFYQYLVNSSDADVDQLLATFTFLSRERRSALRESRTREPQKRESQSVLAQELTTIVHGCSATRSAQKISQALFHGDVSNLEVNDLEQLWQDGLDRVEVQESTPVYVALTDAGLAPSRSAARRLIQRGSIVSNGARLSNENAILSKAEAMFGRFHLIKRGRKSWCIVQHRDCDSIR